MLNKLFGNASSADSTQESPTVKHMLPEPMDCDDERPAKRSRNAEDNSTESGQHHNGEPAAGETRLTTGQPDDSNGSTQAESAPEVSVSTEQQLALIQEENLQLKHQLENLHVDYTQKARQWLESQLQEVSSEKSKLEEDLHHYHKKYRSYKESTEDLEDRLTRSYDRNSRLSRQNEELRAQHSETQDELEKAKKLVLTRKGELASAETFLGTADAISIAEVIKLLESLNEEIFQLSATLSDTLKFDAPRPLSYFSDGGAEAPQFPNLQNIIGTRLLDHFKARKADDNETLPVQIALEARLSVFFMNFVTSWSYTDASRSRIIRMVYQPLWEKEEQAIAGRWRALAWKHSNDLSGFPSDEFRNQLVQIIVQTVLMAGSPESSKDLKKNILDRFGDSLSALCKQAAVLKKAIGQDVTSVDLRIFRVKPDSVFEPEHLTDEYDEPPEQKKLSVMCAIALGLWSIKSCSDGTQERNILLKPKVVVSRTLESLYQPRK